jgi:hypothetical protein
VRMRYIYNVEFKKASRGWLCELDFRVETRRQSTMEDHAARGYSPQKMRGYGRAVALMDALGMAFAFVDAYRQMRAVTKELQALLGEHKIRKDLV